ncbi:hypothetical protein FH972_026665 [Carpinus fangiana]|uniref:GATA-type domain-containing protein n=1 Tax=Carpinus fangiana TaxID=176857 RepID=A0A5N6L4Y4_9ROSI|nr:hypothetical protein FH972_026665 [Carpinus fangiana]
MLRLHFSFIDGISASEVLMSTHNFQLSSGGDDATVNHQETTAHPASTLSNSPDDAAPKTCANCQVGTSFRWYRKPDNPTCNACYRYFLHHGMRRPPQQFRGNQLIRSVKAVSSKTGSRDVPQTPSISSHHSGPLPSGPTPVYMPAPFIPNSHPSSEASAETPWNHVSNTYLGIQSLPQNPQRPSMLPLTPGLPGPPNTQPENPHQPSSAPTAKTPTIISLRPNNRARGSGSLNFTASDHGIAFAADTPGLYAGAMIKPADARGSHTRVYLNQTVTPVVLAGLKEVAQCEPEKPLRWLGEYLLKKSAEIERCEAAGTSGEGIEGFFEDLVDFDRTKGV